MMHICAVDPSIYPIVSDAHGVVVQIIMTARKDLTILVAPGSIRCVLGFSINLHSSWMCQSQTRAHVRRRVFSQEHTPIH